MSEPDTRVSYSLACAQAYPELGISADYKLSPEDFCVSEVLGFEPSGQGEHLYIRVQKRGLTTDRLIADMAKAFAVAKRDIGYSGLKDKHAVTEQWLSIPWPIKKSVPVIDVDADVDADVDTTQGQSLRIMDMLRHDRKLKRGTHKSNDFIVRLSNIAADTGLVENSVAQKLVEQRLRLISELGVPNYFGLQRFGHAGANLEKAEKLFQRGFKCKPFQRGMYYSAARAFLFNQYLSRRVELSCWDQAIAGDLYNLAGTNAVFGPEPSLHEELSERKCDKISERIKIRDIHPVGPLLGRGKIRLETSSLEIAQQVIEDYGLLASGLTDAKVDMGLRALRTFPVNLTWQWCLNGQLELRFSLPTGSYATAVLHEIVKINGEIW